MFSGISSLLSSIFEKICLIGDSVTNGFSNLGSTIGGFFSDLGSKLINGLNSLGSTIGGFFSDLGDGIKKGFDWIGQGIDNLVYFFTHFWDNFFEFLKKMFVPGYRESVKANFVKTDCSSASSNYFVGQFDGLKNSLDSKFNVDSSLLTNFKSSVGSVTPQFVLSFNVLGVPVNMDFSFINKIVPLCHTLFGGLTAIFLVWYHIKNALLFIRGVGMIEGGNISVGSGAGIEFKGSDSPVGSSAPSGLTGKANNRYSTTSKFSR